MVSSDIREGGEAGVLELAREQPKPSLSEPSSPRLVHWTNGMQGEKPLSTAPKVPLRDGPGRFQDLRCIPFVL